MLPRPYRPYPTPAQLSGGGLGILGASVTWDSDGNITDWFVGIDFDVHLALIWDIDGDYKIGFSK